MNLTPVIRQRFFDHSSGAPLAGGKLYTYIAGTTTPQNTYTDQSGGTPNTNPIVLDSNGECSLWVDPTLSYKYLLNDSSGNLQWTVDNVVGILTAGSVNTASLVDGAVTTAKLAANSVTSTILASDASIDGNRAVQTNHIRNSVVTVAKLDSSTTMPMSQIYNLGLSAAAAASALTITATTNSGGVPSATAPCSIGFRSATATSGTYSQLQITSGITVVIPSSATLGHTSALNQYVWVYAINNAGTVELAVSGVTVFPDNSIQSTTTISSGSTSGSVLYSTTARSNVAIRLVGRLLVNESTAGTWAANPSDIVIAPTPTETVTEWSSSTYTITWTGLGTVSANNIWTKRRGGSLYIRGSVTSGTATGVPLKFAIPVSTIDSTRLSATQTFLSAATRSASSTSGSFINGLGLSIFYDGSDTASLYVGSTTTSNALDKNNATTEFGSGNILLIQEFGVPITGWSTYGP